MTNIIIYCGLWQFSEDASVKPTFKVITGTFDENGTYIQYPGYDEPWITTVDELYAHLDSNDDIISLSRWDLERVLAKDGKAYWCGTGHGAYMAVAI